METGYRIGVTEPPIPRDIIEQFVCTYNGEEGFRARLFPAIAANPFISLFTVATESGRFAFAWTDQHGKTQMETAQIKVE
jgi:sulfur-oxidizing protein SoxZ